MSCEHEMYTIVGVTFNRMTVDPVVPPSVQVTVECRDCKFRWIKVGPYFTPEAGFSPIIKEVIQNKENLDPKVVTELTRVFVEDGELMCATGQFKQE